MRKIVAAFAVLILLIYGCATTSTGKKESKEALAAKAQKIEKILNNIPVYPTLNYDVAESFVYESDGVNAAVIVLKGKGRLSDVVSFYKENMPKFGWDLVSMFVYNNKGSMIFDSMESSCQIEIDQQAFNNVKVIIRTGTKSTASAVTK